MHDHIGGHDGHIFLFEDAAALGPVGQDHLDILGGLLVGVGGGALAVAEDHGTALVGHADRGEEGTLEIAALSGGEGQARLLEHLPDGALADILTGLHQSGGELVDIVPQGIAVLPNSNRRASGKGGLGKNSRWRVLLFSNC